jgi:hypothetical protein
MERPTPEELELALMITKLDSPTASGAAKLLHLEVRALQADRTMLMQSEQDCRSELYALRDKLARVEALPKYWRDTSGDRGRAWECAENLDAALKGGA